MARPSVKDPLDKFRWSVQIDEFVRAGFTSCEIPSYSISTRSYREGGAHMNPKQIIDTIEYKPITLMRGVTQSSDFDTWARQALEILNSSNDETQQEAIENFRREIVIEHLDRQGNAIKKYRLFKALPIAYKPASDFAADADDGLSMESITIAYEGYEVEKIVVERNPFSTRGLIKRLVRSF